MLFSYIMLTTTNRKRTAENVALACKMRDWDKKTHREIAEYFGISQSTVRQWTDPEYYARAKWEQTERQKANPEKFNAQCRERRKHFTRERLDKDCERQRKRYAANPKIREQLRQLATKHRNTAQGRISMKIRLATLGHANRFPKIFGPFMQAVTGQTREEFTKRFQDKEGEFDHIIPLCAFDLTNPEHLVRACWKGNVRVIEPRKNQMKGRKVPEGLDIMSLPWVGTQDALVQAQTFISRQLAALEKTKAQTSTESPATPTIQAPVLNDSLDPAPLTPA